MFMSNDHTVNGLSIETLLINLVSNILFILGIIGNILGLLIFSSSRRSWQISSIYACLATCSSITNLLCLIRYVSILHSATRQPFLQFAEQHRWACKFYEFSFSFRVISAWITLLWMFERLLCVSTELRSFFNRWNASKLKFIIPLMIVAMIVGAVVGLPVYMFEPQICVEKINNGTKLIARGCCRVSPNASVQWQLYFEQVSFGRNHYTVRCLFSELIPAGTIILINGYIIYHLRTYRRFHQTSSFKTNRNQSRTTTSWMNIVLILHSSLFLTSLFSHIAGHIMNLEAHETWWVSLAVVINCSLNFYLYCLSGKAFRSEIRRFVQRFETRVFYQ
ncbi:unnamed protein product [Adineta ricciae]|uniref:G-protein coupled receptors family 1 profile domain-containing protein n=1 Tax=Adineta ricciae TaxID=249248 RepID=A0A815DAM0_ADIRI|nr:unnamed protein product [Adineta ricciae]